eukprot:CAMPEP_0178798270 /NCGR_PEP_ID=MMETSP0745-20121128/11663_1 /TAXON_ID=913974 /ORGANISM="Nitzschia punctata, Strain CCMP561" /LENGTH=260 /DNA_ID=CAMNT_0020456905 /DNA_START=21 /DNA_END=804 /DNA_ORIENTATION=-
MEHAELITKLPTTLPWYLSSTEPEACFFFQIAAREAAARQLYEKTGLDIRSSVHRFKPAILRLNPPVDARGVQYLKNEYDRKLYYFLQVDENDFVLPASADDDGNSKLVRPSEDPGDSPLALRLRNDYGGFTFVQDPVDAAKLLQEDGNKEATAALHMIMNEATVGGAMDDTDPAKSPDARATQYPANGDAAGDELNGMLAGNFRTVGIRQSGDGKGTFHDEAELKLKASSDTHDNAVAVVVVVGGGERAITQAVRQYRE